MTELQQLAFFWAAERFKIKILSNLTIAHVVAFETLRREIFVNTQLCRLHLLLVIGLFCPAKTDMKTVDCCVGEFSMRPRKVETLHYVFASPTRESVFYSIFGHSCTLPYGVLTTLNLLQCFVTASVHWHEFLWRNMTMSTHCWERFSEDVNSTKCVFQKMSTAPNCLLRSKRSIQSVDRFSTLYREASKEGSALYWSQTYMQTSTFARIVSFISWFRQDLTSWVPVTTPASAVHSKSSRKNDETLSAKSSFHVQQDFQVLPAWRQSYSRLSLFFSAVIWRKAGGESSNDRQL